MLDGAVQLFNAQGISSTSISAIGATLGLARASIYYYVEDRSDLVFQCYEHSCQVTAGDLEMASNQGSGLEATLAYIDNALTPDRGAIAVLSEITSMSAEHQLIVNRANNRNLKRLRSFLEEGISDGSIRSCDAEIAAQAIVGMLAWAQLLPHWSARPDVPALRKRAKTAMRQMLTAGLACDGKFSLQCPLRAEQFLPVLDNAFDRQESARYKLDQVLAYASKLFNRNGIEATSIETITEPLGVTKGAVYHHFKDKRDLVLQCYERSFQLYDEFAAAAETFGSNGLESALANSHLNIQAQVGRVSPLMPQPGFEAVPPRKRTRFKTQAAAQNQLIAGLLKQGIQQGVAEPCDAKLLTHLSAGAFGWIPKWLPEDRENDGVAIADEICRLIALGLASR